MGCHSLEWLVIHHTKSQNKGVVFATDFSLDLWFLTLHKLTSLSKAPWNGSVLMLRP